MRAELRNGYRLLAGAMLLCLLGKQANAGFVVSVDAPISSGGFTEYTVRALNTGQGTGQTLLGFVATVTTPGVSTATAIKIDFQDIDGDGEPDANITGIGFTKFGTTGGTYMYIGSAFDFGLIFSLPANPETDPGRTGAPTQAVNSAYTNLHSLEIEGELDSNQGKGTPANTGRGAPFANIVIPTGTQFTISGEVGGEVGPATPFSLSVVPEVRTTTQLAILAGVAGLRLRQRRLQRSATVV